MSVLNLDDRIVQLQLTQGAMNVRVSRLDANQVVEVDTPNLAFTMRKPGAFRIEVDADGDATTIVVRNGQGEVVGEGASYVVDARQPYRFTGTGLRDYERVDAPRLDDVRPLVGRARPHLRPLAVRALRLARRRRLPGPRRERHVARRSDVRQRVDPEPRRGRLGAVPRRSLGVGRPLGLDLGGRRALGLRRVPLRSLGEPRRHVGMGAGSDPQPGVLRAGAGGLRRRRRIRAGRLGRQFPAASAGSRSARARSIGRRTR